MQWRDVDLAVAQHVDQWHQPIAHLVEQLRGVSRPHAGSEVIEHNVVWVVVAVEAVDVVARELEVALERRREQAEVVRRTRGDPRLIALGRGLRAGHRQLDRNTAILLVLAPCLGHDACLDRVRRDPVELRLRSRHQLTGAL